MSSEKRIEKLRGDIGSSQLLDDREKGDWLNLLELMNDKQLGELEEILKSPSSESINTASAQSQPTSATPPIAQAVKIAEPASVIPALSHISNMPAAISYEKPQPYKPAPISKVVAPRPLPKDTTPFKPQTSASAATNTKNSPFGMPVQTKGSIVNMTAPLKQTLAQHPVATKPVIGMAKPSPLKPLPDLPKQPASTSGSSKQVPLELGDLADLTALDLTKFRNSDTSGIVQNFLQLVARYGYFNVVQSFEDSKLYKSYINRGKMILSGESAEGKFTVNQEEFELIADLLSSIRVNR